MKALERVAGAPAWIVSLGAAARAAMCLLAVCGLVPAGRAAEAGAVPAWLFPVNSPADPAPADAPSATVRLAGSSVTYTRAQLTDLFSAPDWGLHPHGPMPDVVVHGRRPDIRACGFCHTPTGQGRPENAALAGLPRGYLTAQLKDFRDGKRRGAWPGDYPPADLMLLAAQRLSDDEIEATADYFSQQHAVSRTEVRETATVPRSRVVGLVYSADPAGGTETLGLRLLEFAPDPARHEQRDDAMRYIAYVPPESIARGRALVGRGRPSAGVATCTSCHGPDLHGAGPTPAIGGRSATYLLRSLYAFRTGARSAPTAAPMQALTRQLSPADLLDAVAYVASLPP